MKAGHGAETHRLSAVWVLHADPGRTRSRSFNLDLRVRVSYVLAHVALADGEIGNADLVPSLQLHGAPDPAGHKARPPVPAVFISRLPNVSLGVGLRLRLPWVAVGHLRSSLDRRWKHDPQHVLTRVQMALDRHSPNAEHIVRCQHLSSIHIDLRGCIKAAKDKVHIGASKHGSGGIE